MGAELMVGTDPARSQAGSNRNAGSNVGVVTIRDNGVKAAIRWPDFQDLGGVGYPLRMLVLKRFIFTFINVCLCTFV